MIADYKECIEKFGSKYKVKMMLAEESLYKLDKGIYSDKSYAPEYQIISRKYPQAIFTLDSAFYFHKLTDVIPDKNYLMTSRGSAKIRDERVVQIFENSDILRLGAEFFEVDGFEILIYNKERMLLELLRNKNKLAFDYYKEVLNNYRKIIDELDIRAIQDMLEHFPKNKMITEALELEVF